MIITVINRSEGAISDKEVTRVVRAVNTQIKRDFVPFWGMACTLRLDSAKPSKQDLPDVQDACVLYLQKEIDVEGALGYHDANHAGIPFGVVFTELAAELHEPWSVTFSHEVLELIGDPQANLLVMGPHPADPKHDVFHWFEMCDAVQADHYHINGVVVSNFVLPFYFTAREQNGQNDFLDTGLKSFKLNKGGYIGFYDPKKRDHDTFERRGDKLAVERAEIKGKLGMARRSNRYKADHQERANLLGRLPTAKVARMDRASGRLR